MTLVAVRVALRHPAPAAGVRGAADRALRHAAAELRLLGSLAELGHPGLRG